MDNERKSRLGTFNERLSIWFERVAVVAVLGMILGTLVDVTGAKLFHWPLPVGTEAIYLLQTVAMAGAIAISKIDGRHVRIELIDRLPQPALGIIHAVVAIVSLALFSVLSWTSVDYALSLKVNNEVTTTSQIALYPFAIWMALCCVPVVLILIDDFVKSLLETTRR